MASSTYIQHTSFLGELFLCVFSFFSLSFCFLPLFSVPSPSPSPSLLPLSSPSHESPVETIGRGGSIPFSSLESITYMLTFRHYVELQTPVRNEKGHWKTLHRKYRSTRSPR